MTLIKSPLAVLLSLLASSLFAGPSARASLVLPGPSLTGDIIAWSSAGVQFTALRTTRLQSFTFENQGQPDVVSLTDSGGNVLSTYSVSAGNPRQLIQPDWLLESGTTYQLTSALPDNGRWTDYRNFPAANDDLSVNGVVGRGTLEKIFWFSFTNLTTHTTPEPSSLALLLLIAPVLICRRSA